MIQDITEFVKEQKLHVDNGNLEELLVPVETVYQLTDEGLRKHINVD